MLSVGYDRSALQSLDRKRNWCGDCFGSRNFTKTNIGIPVKAIYIPLSDMDFATQLGGQKCVGIYRPKSSFVYIWITHAYYPIRIPSNHCIENNSPL